MDGNQPHDHFFKAMMARPGMGEALLHERLPPAIATRLADGAAEPLPESFIDPQLTVSQADLLLRARFRDGKPVYVYCLVEHKSWVDRRVALQLLRYLSRAWDRLAKLPEHRKRLPLILPLVVYHGAGRWLAPTRFAQLLDLDAPEQLPLVLDFPFLVVDLGQTPDEALSRQPLLAAGLRLLKHGFALPAGERVGALFWLLAGFADDLEYLVFALSYILKVHPEVTQVELWLALHRIVPGKEQEMLSKAALDFIEQGRLEGEARGEARGLVAGRVEGLAEGLRIALLQLLERRFGALPAPVRKRVEKATGPEIDGWFDRAVDASTLEAVFGSEER